MHELSSKRHHQRGATMVLFTMMLALVLLPITGLAIDGGFVYLAHSRLVAAADSAALAGARSLNLGLTFEDQKVSAANVATQYLEANIPPLNPKNLNNEPNAASVAPDPANSHIWTVTVNPTLTVNLYFMPMFGFPTATVSAYAQSSRRDANIMLTLDISGSMGTVCNTMTTDAINFVSKFSQNLDSLGLVTFMGYPNLQQPLTKEFLAPITNDLKAVNCTGNTGSAEALWTATQQLKAKAEPGALNVIVFFTDGVPNGYSANFIPKSATCNNGTAVSGYISDSGGISSNNAYTTGGNMTVKGCTMGSLPTLSNTFKAIPSSDINGLLGTGIPGLNYKPVPVLIPFSPNPPNLNGPHNYSDYVSINAADYAAWQARTDLATGGITIYTIGLEGNGGFDPILLQRMANDPSSPIYDRKQPTGKFYDAPNAAQLASIWDAIASQILRISR